MSDARKVDWEVTTAINISRLIVESLSADAKTLDDSTVAGMLARAKVFGFAGYHRPAIASLRRALAIDPQCHEAAARLVGALLRVNEHEDALAVAAKLVASNADFTFKEVTSDEIISGFTLLGDALAANGRSDDAIEAYQIARKRVPKDSTAAARLAQAHIASGERKQALAQADAFAENPRFRDLHSVLALGKYSEALLPKLGSIVAQDAAGRPMLIEGTARVAPAIEGDDRWC